MKRLNIKVLFTSLFMAVAVSSFAQQQIDYSLDVWDKYGESVEEREANFKTYSFFNEEYTARNYPVATSYLKTLLANIPKVSLNLYIRGVNMYRGLLMREKDMAKRTVYADSLMILYDMRTEHFGTQKKGAGYIVGEKVKDIIRFKPMDFEFAIETLNKGIEANGQTVPSSVMPIYFDYLTRMYTNDAVETSVILSQFSVVTDFLTASADAQKALYIDQVEKLLIGSGAASCDDLEAIFKPQFEAAPDDAELIARILRQLKAAGCASDFQVMLAEKNYLINPTPDAAVMLASTFEGKKDFEKASFYYNEAIAKASDDGQKIALALTAAGANLLNGRPSEALGFTNQALAVDPHHGLSLFILAQCQAQLISCSDEFAKQSAFWIVVDNLLLAKKYIDEDKVKEVQDAINAYSANFPLAEELFFRELQAGANYTVDCGAIKGTTIIRVRR